MTKYYQTTFRPRNPSKYVGDPSKIFARSSWEVKMMIWLDTNPSIKQWNSEEIIVPYFDPATGRNRRYFPDFAAVIQTLDGSIEKVLIEVKPNTQTRPPKKPTRMTKRYITEVQTYVTNQAKWEAATNWAKQHGFDRFQIVTEKELYGK